jgi:hypothetical protein
MLRKLVFGTTAAALMAASTVAQAAPVQRTSAPISAESEEIGGIWVPIIGAIVFAVIVLFVIDEDDTPTSP